MRTRKLNRFVTVFTLMAAMITGAGAQSWLTNGLLAYYPFDGTASDATGSGHDGVGSNVVWGVDRFNRTNACLSLNGNGVVTTAFLPPTGTSPRTISGWFYTTNSTNAEAVLSYGLTGAPPGYGGGNFILDCIGNAFDLDVGYTIWSANYAQLPGAWHHFAVVAASNIYLNSVQFYLDGVLQTNPYFRVGGQNQFINTDTNATLRFGQGSPQGCNPDPFYGRIDDVRIYNRAFSSNEVAQLYAYESTSESIQITGDLTNFYAVYGHDTIIGVTASATSPLSYQWYFAPSNNAGEASGYAQIISGFVYGAVVTNGGYGYGNIPQVSFAGGGGQGARGYGMVSNGAVTGITVTNAGSGYSNLPTVLIDPPNGLLIGQTNSTLTISNASENSLGLYSVVVSGTNDSITSHVVNLILAYPPGISTNPAGFTGAYHSSNSLTVTATGTAPLGYQWLLNSTNIAGATNMFYNITNLTLSNSGAYNVEVTNPFGNVLSSNAYVFPGPDVDAAIQWRGGLVGPEHDSDGRRHWFRTFGLPMVFQWRGNRRSHEQQLCPAEPAVYQRRTLQCGGQH